MYLAQVTDVETPQAHGARDAICFMRMRCCQKQTDRLLRGSEKASQGREQLGKGLEIKKSLPKKS